MAGSLIKFPAAPIGEASATAYPAGWTVVGGEPLTLAQRHYLSEDGVELSGFWKCSPGVFEVVYDKWEFCHVLAGRCVITPAGGAATEIGAGDAFIVESGFRGRWEVVETMSKNFVFVTAPAKP